MSEVMETLYESVLEGEKEETLECVQKALDEGIAPDKVLNEGMIAAMKEVGQLFEDGDYFVPEMLIAARAMQAGLEILRPKLVASGIEPVGKVVLGTVKGDLHDIGKNLVGMMLEGAGFDVLDLGTDVAPETFVEAITDDVDIIGLSALLTTTMPSMQATIKAIHEAGLKDKVKIMVGGAPVTTEYAQKINADGYAADAGQAAALATSFIE
ncbi:MAG: cobalamin-binding protein [Chloroflexi bacterium]|nr:cobalamin-binding protein [Chloroflexota bacterium]